MKPVGYAGMARLKKIFADFNAAEDVWETYQSRMMCMFCNAMLKHILGTDRDRCIDQVMALYGWTSLPDEVLVLAPRGSGKTRLLIGAIAAFFVNIPDFTCCLYAGVAKKSLDFYRGVIAKIKYLVSLMPETKRPKIIVNSNEAFIVEFGNDKDQRWIRQFSTIGMVRHLLFFVLFLSLSLFLPLFLSPGEDIGTSFYGRPMIKNPIDDTIKYYYITHGK
jgi:hypothetical protein